MTGEFGKEIIIEMTQQYNSLSLEDKEKLLENMEILPTFAHKPNTLLELLPLIEDGIISLGGDALTSNAMTLVQCTIELAKIASKREDIVLSQSLQSRFPDIPWDNIRNNESPEDIGKRIEQKLQILNDESVFNALFERIKNSLEQRSNRCTAL